MLLKRHYRRTPKGELVTPPQLDHVEVKHTGTKAEQNFSESLVRNGVAGGFVTLGKGRLVLHVKPEDLVYAIKRVPGYYCCHCGVALPDAGAFVSVSHLPGVTVGMQHVADAHGKAKSPDPGNPSGYCRLNHYETTLEAKQHEKFRLKRVAPPRAGKGG
jgi:hypothetical protein